MTNEGWTIETLKEHFDQLRDADNEAVKTALASQEKLNQQINTSSEKAITKAENAQKEYNIIHNDLVRKNELMATKEELKIEVQSLEDKLELLRISINSLTTRLDLIAGKGSGIKDFYGWIVAALAILFMILTYLKK